MKRDTTTSFGTAVRRLRKQAGLTQAALAERADLAVESVSRIETGRFENVTLHVARALAQALNTEVAALFLPDGRRRNPAQRPAEARALALLAPLSSEDAEAVVRALGTLLRVKRVR